MKRINFYLEQVVAKEDLALLQDNIESMFAALIEDLGIRYAYNGMHADANNPNAMAVRVHPGRCYFGFDGCGQHGVLSTIQLVALNLDKNGAATAVQANGNERWLSVWIIPKTVSDTPVITPAGITIQYRTYDSVDFAVTMGAEAAIGSASRPALESVTNGILICDVRLTYGMTTVPNANIDASRVLSYGQSGQERGALPYLLNTLDNTVSRLNAAEQNIVAIQTELDNFETDTANRLATVNHTLTYLTDHWNAIYASLQTSAGANEIGYQYSSTYGSNTVGAALKTLMQNQPRLYTTGGTAPDYTLTPTPDLTAYAAGQRFNVFFASIVTAVNNTLNISGLGARSLMQYAQDGSTLIPATVTPGLIADVEYNGTYFILLNPAPSALGTSWAVKKLVLSTTGSSNAVTWSADEIVLSDSNGNQILRRNLSYSAVPSLDTGTIAASTWYYVWALYNSATGADGWFVSTSSSAPTMGSWTHKALISALKTNTTPCYLAIQQRGRAIQYKSGVGSLTTYPVIGSGVANNAAASVSPYIPTAIAGKGTFMVYESGGQSFLSANETTNVGSCPISSTTNTFNWSWTVTLVLESTNVYFTGTTNTSIQVVGFELNI